MGSLFKSKTETTKTKAPFKTEPWKPQQEPIKEGFSAAQGALSGAMGGIPKDMTADLTSGQTQDLGAISTLGRNTSGALSAAIGDGTAAMGGTTLGTPSANAQSDRFDTNSNSLFGQAGSTQGTDRAKGILSDIGNTNFSGMSGEIYKTAGKAGMGAAQDALTMGKAGPQYSKSGAVFDDVSSDMTGTVVGNAGQYAANPYLDGQIDAVLGDINRNFQQERGNINAAAVGTGNINSTRAGTLEAYASRDAMDRAASTAATMRGEAYSKGLDLATSAEQTRREGSLSANSQLQQDDAYKLDATLGGTNALINAESNRDSARLSASGQDQEGALGRAGLQIDANGQTIAAENSRIGNMLDANTQVGQGADRLEDRTSATYDRYGAAQDIATKGYEGAFQGLADSLTSGNQVQGQSQAEIAGKLQAAGLPLDFVQQYMASIGGNFGSQGFQTNVSTSQSPSIFQQVAGAATSGLGAWGSFRK